MKCTMLLKILNFLEVLCWKKDIQCIQGEKYMEKYRKKDVEEEI